MKREMPKEASRVVKVNKLSTDGMMWNIASHLVADLDLRKDTLPLLAICARRDIKAYRSYRLRKTNEPYYFKKVYQIEALFKRYIFEKDVFTATELREKAASDFIESQTTFGLPQALPLFGREVLEEARKVMCRILGSFDRSEFVVECKWGKRAALDLPGRAAYLDNRMNTINGNRFQLAWLRYITLGDKILTDCTGKSEWQKANCVNYSTVPKSHKSMRGIAPDTTVGGFLSAGLGVVIRRRLETATHIDLSRAQYRHRQMAKASSITGKDATIDMSKASDSFTWDHICALVPEDWRPILRAVRTPFIKVGDEVIPLKSYMLMGSGHTFPLQTALFYSLAQAACNLAGIKRKPSVYGDDIIIDSRVAPAFISAMQVLGFTINQEKSFLHGPFRESCGGDYHTGVDVRPFMLEGTGKPVSPNAMLSTILQVLNGLLERWSEVEICSTIAYLCSLWSSLTQRPIPIGQRGIQGPGEALLWRCFSVPYEEPQFASNSPGSFFYEQYVLRERKSRRKLACETPYYWDTLRSSRLDGKRNILGDLGQVTEAHGEYGVDERKEPCSLLEPAKGIKTRYVWKKIKIFPYIG